MLGNSVAKAHTLPLIPAATGKMSRAAAAAVDAVVLFVIYL